MNAIIRAFFAPPVIKQIKLFYLTKYFIFVYKIIFPDNVAS